MFGEIVDILNDFVQELPIPTLPGPKVVTDSLEDHSKPFRKIAHVNLGVVTSNISASADHRPDIEEANAQLKLATNRVTLSEDNGAGTEEGSSGAAAHTGIVGCWETYLQKGAVGDQGEAGLHPILWG